MLSLFVSFWTISIIWYWLKWYSRWLVSSVRQILTYAFPLSKFCIFHLSLYLLLFSLTPRVLNLPHVLVCRCGFIREHKVTIRKLQQWNEHAHNGSATLHPETYGTYDLDTVRPTWLVILNWKYHTSVICQLIAILWEIHWKRIVDCS